MACYALEMTLYLVHIDRGAKQHYPAPRAFVLGSGRMIRECKPLLLAAARRAPDLPVILH